jgi:hypothetical protein
MHTHTLRSLSDVLLCNGVVMRPDFSDGVAIAKAQYSTACDYQNRSGLLARVVRL